MLGGFCRLYALYLFPFSKPQQTSSSSSILAEVILLCNKCLVPLMLSSSYFSLIGKRHTNEFRTSIGSAKANFFLEPQYLSLQGSILFVPCPDLLDLRCSLCLRSLILPTPERARFVRGKACDKPHLNFASRSALHRARRSLREEWGCRSWCRRWKPSSRRGPRGQSDKGRWLLLLWRRWRRRRRMTSFFIKKNPTCNPTQTKITCGTTHRMLTIRLTAR